MSARLFEPLRLDDLELENRIIIAPMCQYSAEQGSATDWHMIHLGSLALSGAGLMIVEATAVSPAASMTRIRIAPSAAFVGTPASLPVAPSRPTPDGRVPPSRV